MGIDETLGSKRAEILRIASKHGAKNVRVFGSVARGDAGPGSDVDLLVETEENTSSFFPAGLAIDLEELLAKKVDIITVNGLDRHLRERVLKEAVRL